MVDFLAAWVDKYPICSIEDGCSEDDWESWKLLSEKVGGKVQLVGDDLFVTNVERLQRGIDEGIANSILIKVNQIGTISEAFDMVRLAYRNNYGVMPCSSRGEGALIADYTVGLNTGHLRGGATGATGNRFLQIEQELCSRVQFLGRKGLKP